MRMHFLVWCCTIALSFCPARLSATEMDVDQLAALSLEDLMDIEITSASKKVQRVGSVPAAVYVLAQDEIRRAGARNLPEALKLVPGVHVGQIDNGNWAIGVRGFQGLFANKLLVLIDGRSVYSPLFSGVHWGLRDVLLEDIDRIEVIRGPGASVWGANAVNGVINIITKSSTETKGRLAKLGLGSQGDLAGAVRQGGDGRDGLTYRVYAKVDRRDEQEDFQGVAAADDRTSQRLGFRIDDSPSAVDDWSLHGGLFANQVGETKPVFSLTAPFSGTVESDNKFGGAHLLGNWTRRHADGHELTLQSYYDRTTWDNGIYLGSRYTVDTVDVDLTHRMNLSQYHDVVWGLGYRLNSIDTENGDDVSFDNDRNDSLFSGFLQDEIALFGDRARLTLGTKLEHNPFTGFELQPTARALVTPHPDHVAWVAVSRAVRTPSPAETDTTTRLAVLPPSGLAPLPTAIDLVPNDDAKSEIVIAVEAGYRVQPTPTLNLDLALFYNIYDNLLLAVPGETTVGGLPPAVFTTQRLENVGEARTYGFELAAEYQLQPWWRLRSAYSLTAIEADSNDSSTAAALSAESLEDATPRNQLLIRSSMDLFENVEMDLTLRYVDEVERFDLPAYTAVDVRLGWQPADGVELSIIGQNLFDDRHPEYQSEAGSPLATEVPRSLFARLALRF